MNSDLMYVGKRIGFGEPEMSGGPRYYVYTMTGQTLAAGQPVWVRQRWSCGDEHGGYRFPCAAIDEAREKLQRPGVASVAVVCVAGPVQPVGWVPARYYGVAANVIYMGVAVALRTADELDTMPGARSVEDDMRTLYEPVPAPIPLPEPKEAGDYAPLPHP